MKSIILILFIIVSICWALDNGVARTPPMGWNTWNHFGCNTSEINEDLIYETAMAMITSGMAAAGYEYINLDDCWFATERDSQGRLQADPVRFPNGIAPLAEYVHSLGLKMGIYEDVGSETCMGYPGSLNNYKLDIETFASWGIDYVKFDGCNFDVDHMNATYTEISQILNATGRPMVYSCSWPTYAQNETLDFTYIGSICNLWREFDDIRDNFDSWTTILDEMQENNRAQYAGPGHWNDGDMLEIGNGGQTMQEYQSFMSMWSMIAGPLIAGNDLRSMNATIIQILTNVDVIAVDQDPLGIQGSRIYQNGTSEIWRRPLINSQIAIVLFNRGLETVSMEVTYETLGLDSEPSTPYLMRDLWLHSDSLFSNSISFNIPTHQVVMLTFTPTN